MRNFMGYDRRWLDEPHLGDHVGRSIWALGEILSTAWVPAVVGPTRAPARHDRRARSRPSASLRTGAYAALGLARLDPDRLEPEARQLLERVRRAARRRLRDALGAEAGTGSRTRSPTTTPGCRTR